MSIVLEYYKAQKEQERIERESNAEREKAKKHQDDMIKQAMKNAWNEFSRTKND